MKWERGHDVNENKTVFIRNLSFNSDEEDLKDMMDQNFGKVLFAKICIDRVTEHPKGTGFVKFATEESAKKCIEAAESRDGLWLDDRQIYALLALKPDEAKVSTENEMKNSKSANNLWPFLFIAKAR